MSEWKWMFGICHGIGECAWEENDAGKMRHITRWFRMPNGPGMFMKASMYDVCADETLLVDTGDLVVCSAKARPEASEDLTGLWQMKNIINPMNGGQRFRMT
jgi:hypothetical protein